MFSQISTMVKFCVVWSKKATFNCEPMIITPLPKHPWQVVGSDIFTTKKTHTYWEQVIFPDIQKSPSFPLLHTSHGIIFALRLIFARHGVPKILRSDNGP